MMSQSEALGVRAEPFCLRSTLPKAGLIHGSLGTSFSLCPTTAMAAFVAVPSSAANTALRGSLTHVPQAAPSPAPPASLAVKRALGVAAVGAAVAAGTRRKHRVVVCAGAMLPEGRKLRVAVIGGGPAGASTADALAQEGIETYLIERKLDNCKPCGGAIPLCMIEDFDLPKDIVDRQACSEPAFATSGLPLVT
eukprot:s5740_g1.t1